MPQIEPLTDETMTGVFWPLGIGLSEQHECEHMAGEISYKPWLKRWCLDTLNEESLPVTYCPWCGEKLPECVIVPPEITEEQLRQWRKQFGRAAKKIKRWMRQIEAPL